MAKVLLLSAVWQKLWCKGVWEYTTDCLNFLNACVVCIRDMLLLRNFGQIDQ